MAMGEAVCGDGLARGREALVGGAPCVPIACAVETSRRSPTACGTRTETVAAGGAIHAQPAGADALVALDVQGNITDVILAGEADFYT